MMHYASCIIRHAIRIRPYAFCTQCSLCIMCYALYNTHMNDTCDVNSIMRNEYPPVQMVWTFTQTTYVSNVCWAGIGNLHNVVVKFVKRDVRDPTVQSGNEYMDLGGCTQYLTQLGDKLRGDQTQIRHHLGRWFWLVIRSAGGWMDGGGGLEKTCPDPMGLALYVVAAPNNHHRCDSPKKQYSSHMVFPYVS